MKKPPSSSSSSKKHYFSSNPYLQPVVPPKPSSNNNRKPSQAEQQRFNQKREDRFENELDPNIFAEKETSQTTSTGIIIDNDDISAKSTKFEEQNNFLSNLQDRILKKMFVFDDDDDSSSFFLSQEECDLIFDVLNKPPQSHQQPFFNEEENPRLAFTLGARIATCGFKLYKVLLHLVVWCVSYDCAYEETREGDDENVDLTEKEAQRERQLLLSLPLKARNFFSSSNTTMPNLMMIDGAFFISQCCSEMNYTRAPPLISSIFRILSIFAVDDISSTRSNDTNNNNRNNQHSSTNVAAGTAGGDDSGSSALRGVLGEFTLFLCWLCQRYDLPRLACVCEILRCSRGSSSSSFSPTILSSPIHSMFDLLFYRQESNNSSGNGNNGEEEKYCGRNAVLSASSSIEKSANFDKYIESLIEENSGNEQQQQQQQHRQFRFALENLRTSYLRNKIMKDHIKPYSIDDFISAAAATSSSSSSSFWMKTNKNETHHHQNEQSSLYLRSIANFQKHVQEAASAVKDLAEIAAVASLSSSRVIDANFVGKALDEYYHHLGDDEDYDDEKSDDEFDDDENEGNHHQAVKARVIKDEKDIEAERKAEYEKLETLRRRNEIVLGLVDQIVNVSKEAHESVFHSWETAIHLGLDQKYLRNTSNVSSSSPATAFMRNRTTSSKSFLSRGSGSGAAASHSSSSSSLRTKIIRETTTELSSANLADFIRASLTRAAAATSTSSINPTQQGSSSSYRPSDIFSKNILKEILEEKVKEGLLSTKSASSKAMTKESKKSKKDVVDDDDQNENQPSSLLEKNIGVLLKNCNRLFDDDDGSGSNIDNDNDDEDVDDEQEEEAHQKPRRMRRGRGKMRLLPIKLLTETPFDAKYRKTLRSEMVTGDGDTI